MPYSQQNPDGSWDYEKYVADGGTLLVDAAGGSNEFADSIQPVLEKLFNGG